MVSALPATALRANCIKTSKAVLKPPPRKHMTSAQRAAFYAAACGEDEYPTCGYCGQPVLSEQKWDAAHEGTPHTWGGKNTAVWHNRCNEKHNNEVVTPLYAKGKRQYRKARDIYRSRKPFRTKEQPFVRTVDGRLLDRVTREPWGSRKDD